MFTDKSLKRLHFLMSDLMTHAYQDSAFTHYTNFFNFYNIRANNDKNMLVNDLYFHNIIYYVNKVYNIGFAEVTTLFIEFLKNKENISLYEISKHLYNIHEFKILKS